MGDEKLSLATWLDGVHRIIGAAGGPELSEAEQAALLDIARIAAHSSERVAAPLTTFLAGVAYGMVSPDERAASLRALADRLERQLV
jgi:hypothetical protein